MTAWSRPIGQQNRSLRTEVINYQTGEKKKGLVFINMYILYVINLDNCIKYRLRRSIEGGVQFTQVYIKTAGGNSRQIVQVYIRTERGEQ